MEDTSIDIDWVEDRYRASFAIDRVQLRCLPKVCDAHDVKESATEKWLYPSTMITTLLYVITAVTSGASKEDQQAVARIYAQSYDN